MLINGLSPLTQVLVKSSNVSIRKAPFVGAFLRISGIIIMHTNTPPYDLMCCKHSAIERIIARYDQSRTKSQRDRSLPSKTNTQTVTELRTNTVNRK